MDNTENEILEQAKGCQQKARAAFSEKKLGESLHYTQEALRLFKECGEDYEYVRCLNMLGIVYANMGDESMAVDYYLEGLEMAQDKKYYDIMSLFYNNIGSRYQELGQHKKAVFYFRKAKEAHEKEENRQRKGYWENLYVYTLNLALSNTRLGELKEANKYLDEMEMILEHADVGSFQLAVLVLKCNITWDSGDREFMDQNLEEMMKLCENLSLEADYIQNVQEFAALLKRTEHYGYWCKLLEMMEEVSEQQDMIYYKIISVEMWMDYYDTVQNTEAYNTCCVRHAELYHMQRDIEYKERIQALDMRIALKEKEEERLYAETKAETDELTGIGNRYALDKASRELVRKAYKSNRLIAVGILDIDCFKQVNDTYGHNAGDDCLRSVAEILKNTVDSYGSVYRFGGDEFVILVDEGDYEAAERIAERVKRKLSQKRIENKNSSVSDILTVSQGYACFRPYEGERLAGLLEHADKALYKVKDDGKNDYRIILEEI